MYANDVMTMAELKEKTAIIIEELEELDYDLRQYERSLEVKQDAGQFVEQYMHEIERFLQLETVTNMDLRRIIDHISVNKDGNVRIILKRLDDLDIL